MAISANHVKILSELAVRKLLPRGNGLSIIEFGEQNWYCDADLTDIVKLARRLELPPLLIQQIEQKCNQFTAAFLDPNNDHDKSIILFNLVKLLYKVVFDPAAYAAIDLHGSSNALKHDLNTPLENYTAQHDVATNFGTSEHVFNQYSFFKTMHNVVKPSGIMLHGLPNQGCFDHGFYNYHPTFFFDLAHANNYKMLYFAYIAAGNEGIEPIQELSSRQDYVRLVVEKKISAQSALFIALQKPSQEKEFVIPQQGYYDDALADNELRAAWQKMPR